MISTQSLIIVVALVFGFLFEVSRTMKRREAFLNSLRDKSNHQSVEDMESQITAWHLEYESLEESYWVHIGALSALAAYGFWGVWYYSILAGVMIALAGIRFAALRPFTTSLTLIRKHRS